MPPDRGQAQQAAQRSWSAALKRQNAQCCVLGDDDSGCVCRFFELAASASEQAADGDFGQCLHSQSQEHPAAAGTAKKARRNTAFFAALQPRTQPNRTAVAQDKTHVDGSEMPHVIRTEG